MPCSWVLLDEVTIGSGHPDLWAQTEIAPGEAAPGDQVVQTIAYGNQGGWIAEQTRITATWPSELKLVGAKPWPSNIIASSLTWDLGKVSAKSSPHHVKITATVASTATMWKTLTNTVIIDTPSTEIETANNAVLGSFLVPGPDLWVKKRAYPQAAMSGEPVIYTITYGNDGKASTSDVRITDVMPPEAILVEANPSPVSVSPILEWNIMDLPGQSAPSSITLTTTVASTVTFGTSITNTANITSSIPELDISNNADGTIVFVGNRTFLPVITKDLYH
jgi:uncharacterized repeat protein (TIGR01451 family)